MPEEPLRLGLTHLQAAEFLYETRLFPEHRVHLQACPHPAGGLRDAAPGAAARAACPHCRGPGGARRGAGGRAGRAPEPTMPCGARCGTRPWHTAGRQGRRPWRGSAHREAVGYFEQALSALPHLPEQRDTRRAGHRSPARPALGAPAVLATLGVSWRCCARPRPSPRPSTTRVDWDRSLRFLSNHFYDMGAYDQAIAAGQRALALATASGESCPARAGELLSSAEPTRPRATIVGRSTASG